ncbi:MAG: cob(I)yrinic acid a,c-diamide adenosyltransferase [Calditrichaeota bacterium]|nr:cob(I)yrinic acid a,c-diamide adenosyltransferase [Calditrichota bacterium]
MTMRITKVYTRAGDDGATRLGGGQKVEKSAVRIRTYGTVDELNSAIGLVVAHNPCEEVGRALNRIQHELFTLGGDLCVLEEDKATFKMQVIEKEQVRSLEKTLDTLNAQLKPLEDFILPGGTKTSAFLHQARCVCRRAESLAVQLASEESLGKQVVPYLNRLSDALFVMARFENFSSGRADIYWQKNA